jgi:hypothetical protein
VCDSGLAFSYTRSADAPRNITLTALIGISTPIPIPVGDGTHERHDFFC